MLDIQQTIYEYICKANRKIAQISFEANELLSKTGCNCDISSFLDDIADINSSLFIINKGWENIELTFGYKNYLVELFPEEDYDTASALLQVIQTYIDRYAMETMSVMISPLYPSQKLGGSCCDGFIDSLYYNKTDSDLRYYPLNLNPAGYLTSETDPTVPAHVKAVTISDIERWNSTPSIVNNINQGDLDRWNSALQSETDPTVAAHVKGIRQIDIDLWNSALQSESDPTVPIHVKTIATTDISNWNSKLSTELDPTVAAHVKAITLANINYWNSKLDSELDPTVPSFVKSISLANIALWNSALQVEVDPTVPAYVKAITEADIDFWNDKITTETDPTVPSFVKSISTTNISNWNSAHTTSLTLTPILIPRSTFTTLSFSRLGGYIVATSSLPLLSTNINLSIGGNVAFSRAVIFHQGANKPTFSGTGITVTEIGSYRNGSTNEILVFYNGDGRVIVVYTGEVETNTHTLITRGAISSPTDTTVNISGFEWEIEGSLYASGLVNGIPVSARPSEGIRVDSFWGDSLGNVIYLAGTEDLNEFFRPYPDRVLLSLFVRKSNWYSHPSYTPINVTTSVGSVISRVASDSIGSLTSVEFRELSKLDVGLGNVDNTSDANKPISSATQAAINLLDSRFLRKDVADTNGLFRLTLGGLTVNGSVILSTLMDGVPEKALGRLVDGTVVTYQAITIADINNLQSQVNGLQNQINNIEGDKNWTHVQAIDSNTWTIPHGLGKRPSISVYDSGNNTVQYEVEFVSLDQVILRFSGSISGTADLN